MKAEKISILGVNISRMNIYQAIEVLKDSIEQRRKLYVALPNVFIVTECIKDAAYRNVINSADVVLADGMPLVWTSYLLGKYTGGRVAAADLFPLLNKVAEREGFSCYFLGGGPGGSEKVLENLKKQLPGLKVVGNFGPPMRDIPDQLNDEIVKRINLVKPDILWVGFGAPWQEKWIYKNIHKLDVCVAIGVGIVFYYQAGIRKRAPLWMRKIGMEWSYRILCENPSLFWKKRYYAYVWEFIFPVLAQITKEWITQIRMGKLYLKKKHRS